MCDASADIQKIVRRDRFEKQFAQSSAESRAHSAHREGDEADKRAAFEKIDIVRYELLQFFGIGFVMDENSTIPVRVKERFTADRQQTEASQVAFVGASDNLVHTFLPKTAVK
jgi:hypothetical protein